MATKRLPPGARGGEDCRLEAFACSIRTPAVNLRLGGGCTGRCLICGGAVPHGCNVRPDYFEECRNPSGRCPCPAKGPIVAPIDVQRERLTSQAQLSWNQAIAVCPLLFTPL